MLILCPECQLQISDKAITCPHCGYPLKPEKAARTISKKRMRLPNGFGQISKINNKNLRNPWRVMVTVGKTPEGRSIQKILKPQGYFHTYNEAYEALLKYHKNPYDLSDDTTIGELFNIWSKEYFKSVSDSTINTAKSAWKYCAPILNIKVRQLTKRDVRNIYENSSITVGNSVRTPSPVVKARIRSILVAMFDYAIEYDLADVNVPKSVSFSKEESSEISKVARPHINFTDEEMNILWQNVGDPVVDMVLIGCYSGWRPQELCTMKKSQVNISEMTMTGGSKTDAGKDRVVPIHSYIQPLVTKYFSEDRETLFARNYGNYENYKYHFGMMLKRLNLNPEHRLHDCRVQFVSMCKKYKVDEYAIKRMVGHAIKDITEAVYTKRNTEWLREEIEKIKGMQSPLKSEIILF